MKSELLMTLEIVQLLGSGTFHADELCQRFGCSVATLKRRLSEARNLGAHVESIKVGVRWSYHVGNFANISEKLERWIALEQGRSLI
jgi:hypothetical protein